MKTIMLQNISFYSKYKEKIKRLYKGKYLVIKDQKVFGVFNSWQEACAKGLALFTEDAFLVKYCA
jgi:hypothetical protein